MNQPFILSTGSYLPEKIVLNEDLTQFPANVIPIISQKTGVKARRHATKDQCTSDLAIEAALKCLKKASFKPKNIDCIIVSTSSPDRIQPATATRVQHKIGASKAFAFDINSVCSGSVYGLFLADSMIRSGSCKNVLFIASEVYSKITNRMDFSTFPYFGDGAGAVLLCSENSPGIIMSRLATDGSGSNTVCIPGGGTMNPLSIAKSNETFFKMNGKKVFDFAISKGTKIIKELIKEAKVNKKEINQFVCHQANINILHKIAENLEIPKEKFFVNLDKYGNTASASVVIALDEVFSNKLIKKDDLVMTIGFGGGLSWGANLIRV